MSAWIIYNCIVGFCLAVMLKVASQHKVWKRVPNLLLLAWFLVLAKITLPPVLPVPFFQAIEQVAFFQGSSEPSASTQPRNSTKQIPGNQSRDLSKNLAESRHLPVVDSNDDKSVMAAQEIESRSSAQGMSTGLLRMKAGGFQGISEDLSEIAVIVWMLGCAVLIFLRLSRYRILHRLVSCGNQLSNEFHDELNRDIGKSGDGLPPIITVNANFSPSLAGLWQPRILLPAWATRELARDELYIVLQHEFQHYRRRDLWLELIAWLATVAMWWNPCAWWVYRELRMAQELCCDAAVIRRGVAAKFYAQTLFRVLELLQASSAESRSKILSMAVLSHSTYGLLERRIRALKVLPHSRAFSSSLLLVICGLLVVILGYPSLAEYQKFLDSFRYQPLQEVDELASFRELQHHWPPEIDLHRANASLSGYEVLVRGNTDFGSSGRPLIMAVVRTGTNQQPEGVACRLAVDINRDEQFSSEEFFEQSANGTNTWLLLIAPDPPSPNNLSVKGLDRTISPLAFQSQHDVRIPEYRLIVKWEKGRLYIAHAARLCGQVHWQGQSLAAELLDQNCNGQWTDAEDRLHIDWNGDKAFSPLGERYSCQQEIVRSGQRYGLAFSLDKLTLEPITRSGTVKLLMNKMEEEARVENLKALLVSQSGIHITGTQVDSPISLPEGTYRLKSLSFDLVGQQTWRYKFSEDPRSAQSVIVVDGSAGQTLELLGHLDLSATVVAGPPVQLQAATGELASTAHKASSSLSDHDKDSTNFPPSSQQLLGADNKQLGKGLVRFGNQPVILQPMLRTESGLFLVCCQASEGLEAGNLFMEESRLIGLHIEPSSGGEKVQSLTDTGFACGNFCPLQFESARDSQIDGFVRLQFDSGPLAGFMSVDLRFAGPMPPPQPEN